MLGIERFGTACDAIKDDHPLVGVVFVFLCVSLMLYVIFLVAFHWFFSFFSCGFLLYLGGVVVWSLWVECTALCIMIFQISFQHEMKIL
jgi:hypothetical protein